MVMGRPRKTAEVNMVKNPTAISKTTKVRVAKKVAPLIVLKQSEREALERVVKSANASLEVLEEATADASSAIESNRALLNRLKLLPKAVRGISAVQSVARINLKRIAVWIESDEASPKKARKVKARKAVETPDSVEAE